MEERLKDFWKESRTAEPKYYYLSFPELQTVKIIDIGISQYLIGQQEQKSQTSIQDNIFQGNGFEVFHSF